MKRSQIPSHLALTVAMTLLATCTRGDPGSMQEPGEESSNRGESVAASVLQREVARIDSAAGSIDSVFQPLPLLTPGEEEALRRFPNAQQLARARALGVERGLSADRLLALEREGQLVRLADSEHWVVRDLGYSQPLVVPGVRTLLADIGERFQDRLASLGSPPYRFEITSALRSAGDQESLRRVNPNAALGVSTHEYGTTVDLLYSAFSAPAQPIVEIDASGAEGAEPILRRFAEVAAERVAGRRSYELKAVLGQVLLEMQREGKVMVTLERQQPVFHITLARDL